MPRPVSPVAEANAYAQLREVVEYRKPQRKSPGKSLSVAGRRRRIQKRQIGARDTIRVMQAVRFKKCKFFGKLKCVMMVERPRSDGTKSALRLGTYCES